MAYNRMRRAMRRPIRRSYRSAEMSDAATNMLTYKYVGSVDLT